MSKHKRPIDENILKAVNDLKWPLINKYGNKVFCVKEQEMNLELSMWLANFICLK